MDPINHKTEELLEAARKGDHKKIEELLQDGSLSTEARDKHDNTPLILAARLNHVSAVTTLLAHGADAKAKNNQGNTAFLLAAARFNQYVMYILLQHDETLVDPRNNQDLTPLLIAAAYSPDEWGIEWLLDKGSSITDIDYEGNNFLSLAVIHNNRRAIVWILDTRQKSIQYRTQTDWIEYPYADGTCIPRKVFPQLTELSVDATNHQGNTALLCAVAKNNEQSVNLLVRYGANVHTRNKSGASPLRLAIFLNSRSIIQALQKAGASLNEEDKEAIKALPEGVIRPDTIALIQQEDSRQTPGRF
jgi:uncharacterized protein